LGVFERTPRRNTSRRRREENLCVPDIVAKYAIPDRFQALTLLYLETATTRLNWSLGYVQQVCLAIATFWQYLAQHYPEIGEPAQVLPTHGKAFIEEQLRLARTGVPEGAGDGLAASAYNRLLTVRTFFSDVCQWATETGSPFAAYAPRTPPLSRRELSRREFEQARKQVAERLKATIFDLERELPKIRAYALHCWVLAEGQLQAEPQSTAAADAEAEAFWNWALLELLVQSGVRVEEATELTTLDGLKRQLPDGRRYYLLHVKPSKFERARLIPIGDGLGRVIAEMMRHIKRFYRTDTIPFCDRWDYTARKQGVRAPYLLQGLGHPSVISDAVVRRRLRALSQRAGAKTSDGSPLILHPHDCRRMFASEHLNNNVPVHVIQALLGHATLDTVMVYAKLYPTRLVEEYRKAVRGVYSAIHGQESLRNPSAEEWAAFESSCSLRDMGTHVCALPTGDYCPRGLVCLGCVHAQPKKSAAPVFRRMLASHERELAAARQRGEPAGQIAARELEVERIRSALRRAEELTGDVAAAIEAAAEGALGASAELREGG
jgi:site-specific recombinase XerD